MYGLLLIQIRLKKGAGTKTHNCLVGKRIKPFNSCYE